MKQHDFLLEVLQCPACRGSLTQKITELKCTQCPNKYPIFEDIPWIFKNTSSTLNQWKAKCIALKNQIEIQLSDTETSLLDTNLSSSTISRLNKLKNSYHLALKQFEHELKHLWPNQNEKLSILESIKERVPSKQHFLSYYETIFRDWIWGDEETKISLEKVLPLLPKNSDLKLLVIGSGAGRLPYEVHKHLPNAQTVFLDINPLLMTVAKKIISGHSVELTEWPSPVLSEDNLAINHKIAYSDSPKNKNIHYLISDGLNLSFKPKSFNLVLTPWFIDIIPQNFSDFSKNVNKVLKKEGSWINFGPLGYKNQNKASSYLPLELTELLISAGFNAPETSTFETPYLKSPFASGYRTEKLILFKAIKNKDSKEPPEFNTLPSFLVKHNEPIPVLPIITQKQAISRVEAEILGAVDGKRSLEEIIKMAIDYYGISEEEARALIISTFIRLIEY